MPNILIHVVVVHVYLRVLVLYPGLIAIAVAAVIAFHCGPHYHFSILGVVVIVALLVDLLMDDLPAHIDRVVQTWHSVLLPLLRYIPDPPSGVLTAELVSLVLVKGARLTEAIRCSLVLLGSGYLVHRASHLRN